MNVFAGIGLGSTRLWVIAACISALLLGLVLSQLDMRQFVRMLADVHVKYLLAALLLLLLEGILTAQRIRLFCSGRQRFSDALFANAWYSILVVVLPARLGEVAAVVVLERVLYQTRGAAMMSIIVQRLFDVMVLCTLFVTTLLGTIDILPGHVSALISLAVVACAVCSIVYMEAILTWAAQLLSGKAMPQRKTMRRVVLRIILQARIWQRHRRRPGLNYSALFLTLLKWISTLTAISILFLAVSAPLAGIDAIIASAAYNFLAVIPIQTIGGLGIGEAGLTAILVAMGLTLSLAVAISIFVRIILIFFPFLFFGLVFFWRRSFQTPAIANG